LPPKNQRNNSAHFTYIFKQFWIFFSGFWRISLIGSWIGRSPCQLFKALLI
jgi:hypothetical protein